MSDQNGFLSEEELLNFDDIQEEVLTIPEWGNKKVRVRALTLEQMTALANRVSKRDPRGGPDIIDRELSVTLTLHYGMVEPKIKAENLARLKAKNAAVITRIVQAINALGPTQQAIDEAAKSDEAGLNGAISVLASPRVTDDAE